MSEGFREPFGQDRCGATARLSGLLSTARAPARVVKIIDLMGL
jgi:hypothetical protein